MNEFRMVRLVLFVLFGAIPISNVLAITQVADPVLSVSAGTSNSTVNVTVTDAGTTIYYTTNGQTPTTANSSITSGQTILINQGQTLKVVAYQGSNNPSDVISETYTASGFISSSGGHTVALTAAGTAWGFGNNSSAQLGLGNSSPTTLPTQITKDATQAAFTGIVPFLAQTSATILYQNGLPEPWEIVYFGALGQNPNALSAAGDGYTLLQEAQLGRNPNDYYQGVAPQLSIVSGNGQAGPAGTFLAQPLIVKVSNSAGVGAANAPVNFSVSGGGGISLMNSGAVQTTMSNVRADSSGQVEVYFQVPATANGSDVITVTAGTTAITTIIFNESATPGNAPTVALTPSSSFGTAPASVTLTAATTGTVSNVAFYEGQKLLGTDTTSPYTMALTNVTAGVHSYKAVATNTATGATGQGTASFNATVAEQPFAQYRYTRGGNTPTTDPSFDTFVIALNQIQGTALASTGNSGFTTGSLPWFLSTSNPVAYHISMQNNVPVSTPGGTLDEQLGTYPASEQFQNPIVAFGAAAGGTNTSLYTNQSYAFGFGSGGQTTYNMPDLRIKVYAKSAFTPGTTNVAPVATFNFTLPRQGTAAWTTFAQGGYKMTLPALTSGSTTYPLVTSFQYQPPLFAGGAATTVPGGFGTSPSEGSSPFILTHTDTSPGVPAYYYEIDYEGVSQVETITVSGNNVNELQEPEWMAMASPSTSGTVYATGSSGAYSYGYTMDFTQRPTQLSTFISQPQFQGQPVPQAYANMSVQELLNVSTQVNFQFANPTAAQALTTVNNSPELEDHPVLDKLVTDLGNNPMAIANYVLNNIHLTDALSFDRNGSLTDTSISCGGVDRGAMATYMEQEGNPVEQCGLLIYLLRKAGVPCGYVFPANDSLQMLDQRMSSILRMQLHNAVDINGNQIPMPTPQIIPVNYPWVAAYIGGTNSGGNYTGGTWYHIFPWMKDTSITEGYDLDPLMPGPGSGTPTANSIGYQSGFAWMLNYIQLDPNIMNLSSQWDDPAHLFFPFVTAQLAQYNSTHNTNISLSNIGLTAFDRQNIYTSWTQFPQPWNLTGTLSSANFEPTLAQLDAHDAALSPAVGSIFNTVTIGVGTTVPGSGTGTYIFSPTTVTLPTLDLHDRRLMLRETQTGTNAYTMTLSLAPFNAATGTTGQGSFSGMSSATVNDATDLNMVNKQVLAATNLPASDIEFFIQTTYTRNLNLPNGFSAPSTQWGQYLGVIDENSFSDINFFFSGDLVTYCFDDGAVTQQMLNLHAQNYWNAQQAVLNGSTPSDPDDLMGEPVYLMGLSLHNAVDNFRQQTMALYKTTQVSYFRDGTAKMEAARTTSDTLPGGVITLQYPAFDITQGVLASAAYNSANANTGVPYPQDAAYVVAAGSSADEATVINQFFNETGTASTTHVLQVAQKAYLAGNGTTPPAPPYLTSQNYSTFGATNYTAMVNGSNVTQPLSTWAGGTGSGTVWSTISANEQSNPYAFAYLTPGAVTAANGSYTGMGYLIGDGYGDVESLLENNAQLGEAGGGNGQGLPSPYNITTAPSGASSPSAWPLTYNGSFYTLGDLAPTSGNILGYFAGSDGSFSVAFDDAAIANGSDVEDLFSLEANFAANLQMSYIPSGSTVPTTPAPTAAQAVNVQTGGWFGQASFSSVANKILQTVGEPVDAIEGGFHVDETDLTMPGPLPIQLQRHYYSLNQADNEFGYGWTLSYEPYLVVGAGSSPIIYATEMDGSVIAYSQKSGSTTTWIPLAANNPSLANQHGNQAGGLTNLFNNVITLSGTTYTLTGADGSVRTYTVSQYPNGTGTYEVTRSRPYLTSWTDPQGNTLTFTIQTDSTKIDYGKLNRIASSNGNYIQLDYDNFGHILTAIASDGRQCSYTYNTYGDLTSVTRTDGSVVSYAYDSQPQTVNGATQNYSDHLLIQENKPNGRQLVNTYNTYPDRRVHTQQSTVGTAGALATTATFVYTTTATNSDGTINGNTTVADAYGRITTYTYSESEITKIQDPSPLTTSISQMWYQTTNGSGAYNRSLQQTVDKRGLTQNFLYDANGNRKETDTVGDLTGSGASSTHTVTATYNAQNLPTLVTDTSTGDNTAFAYTSSLSPYLCTQMQSFASGGAVSTTTYTYGNVTGPPFANGLLESAVVAGSSGTQAETDYAYNNQGYSTSEKIYSETNDPNVTYTFSYNPTGQLVKKTDSAGRFTQLGYDALGNLIAEENYDHSGNLMGWNYNYFDQNGELQWTEGPRINPDDYTYRSYDGAGRLNQLLQYRSQANSTGTGVVQATGNGFIGTTSYSYDLFGDQTLMMDANGNTVVSGYDSIGRLTSRAYYDSGSNLKATEGFTYDTNQSGDKVATYTNPLGGVTQFFYTQTGELTKQINPDNSTEQWFYQLDGRLSKEIYRNGSNRTLAYNDASLVVTSAYQDVSGNSLTTQSQGYDCRGNLISSVDGEGFLTSSTFDGLDRVKSVTGPPAANGSAAQQLTYSYDSAGITDIATDSLGESTVTTYDALYRPVQININSSSGATVRSKGFSYSPDHQSVTSFDGTNTNVTTTWTDIQGSPVLVQNADGTFSTEGYDSNENATSSTDALNRTTNFTFDGLNRVIQQQLPDGALIAFGYDNAGNLTSRGMPNNLNWSATYNSSSLILSEKLMQGTNNTTRSYGYQYYPSGNNIGELQTVSDPRTPSIVSTYSYDGFNRVKSVAAVDPSSAQLGVTQNYKYDNRGLLTELDQSYQNSALSPPTSIIRSYDGYGAILTEQVYLNGSLKDTWVENHDGAGRRTQLTEFNHASKPFGYQYQADGSLTETSFNSQNYLYAYGLDGLLNTRTTPFNTQSVVSRDSVGRVLEQKQVVGSTTYLDEKVQTSLGASAWRGDSTQGNYIATRTGTGAWNETRSYGYDDSTGQRGHLLTESFAPSSGTSSTLTYQFDGNTTGGLGQRTSAALTSGPLTGGNSSTYSTFARLSQQTVSGSLVQPPAIASPVNDTSYDLTGELTSHNPGSNADTLTWDALGRLVSMKRNPTGNGFSWSAVYDGFGRRQQTNYQAITGGTNSGSPLVTQSSFDPDVQFLEAAVTVNGTREWMVHGPDVDGGYGDLQGTGGVDAVVNDSTSTATGVFSDIYGHAVATVSGTTVTWNTVRSSSYGPQPGTTALPLDGVHDVSTFLNWHGRYVDGTGFYNLGNRLYDPSSGTFLSADPLGHAASMDLYSYAGGDPVNYYDPQGLVATKFGQTVDRGLRANRWIIAPEDLSAIEAFPQQAYDAFHYSPSVLDQSRINQTLALSAQNDGGFNPDTASGTMALGVEDLLAQSSFFAAHNESFLQNTRGGLDIASSATIVGLEGHAAYNIASAPIQSQAINLPGSVELTGVQLNKLIGDTTADAIAARYPFALREVPINTVGGKRILDVVVVGGAETLGIESKVGKTVLSNPAIRQELARDWWLLRQGQVDTITWEFTPSPITGKVGPDAALQAMLDKLGIKTIINQ